MNRLLITGNNIEWAIQNIANSWMVEEFYSEVKVVNETDTYKITSTDDSIIYCILPKNLTVIKYTI